MTRVALIQAGLGSSSGTSAALLAEVSAQLTASGAALTSIDLAIDARFATHERALSECDAIAVATGTYWDSWSSHLQRFLEDATESEGTTLWLGKPAAVLVSAHAVGAKGVLSRLQGVLVTLGCSIPPMSGLVVTLASELALAYAPEDRTEDLWRREDLATVAHNLLVSARRGSDYRAWPVQRGAARDPWIAH